MKKEFIIILAIVGGVVTLLMHVFLVYREWSPTDKSATSTYYISPSSSDTNNGTNASTWKTEHSTLEEQTDLHRGIFHRRVVPYSK